MANKKKKLAVDSISTLHNDGTSVKKLKKDKKFKKKLNTKKKLIANLKNDVAVSKSCSKEKIKESQRNHLKKKKKIKAAFKAEKKNKQNQIKPKNFGAVSSDSEPEPIDPDWVITGLDDKNNSWQDDNSNLSPDSKMDPHKMASEMSTDLEQSESDYDEVLDETELNSLIVRSGKRRRDSSENDMDLDDRSGNGRAVLAVPRNKLGQKMVADSKEEDNEIRDSSKRTSAPPNQTQKSDKKKRKKRKKRKSKTEPTCPNPAAEVTDPSTPSLSLNDTMGLVKEIRRRAIDLASRSLYVTPVPPDCNLERLRQLSPDFVSCRLSYNPVKKCCRRYAFLEYRDSAAALVAQKSISGRLFAGQNVSAQPVVAQLIPESADGLDRVNRQQLFITGLHPTVTKSDLHHVFPKAEIEYPFHSAGFSPGYAIAKFVNEAVAFESFVKSHQIPIRGCTISINYVIHPPRMDKTPNSVGKSTTESNAANVKPAQSDQTAFVKEKLESSSSDHATVQTTDMNKNTGSITQSTTMTTTAPDIPSTSNKKTKVLIQPITDIDDNEEEVADDVMDIFTKYGAPDGQFLRKCQDPPSCNSNVLTRLFHSQKQNKTNSLSKASKKNESKQQSLAKSDEEDKEENDNDGEDGDDSEQSIVEENSVEEDTAGDDSDGCENDGTAEEEQDEQSASVAEDGESAESATSDDGDDGEESDGVEDDDPDDASASDQPDDESNSSERSNLQNETSVLFKRPPNASERAAMGSKVQSSDEEIDETLRTVIQSRRTSMRALKTAGSKRPWLPGPSGSKGAQKRDFTKTVKPFELPVPTKRRIK